MRAHVGCESHLQDLFKSLPVTSLLITHPEQMRESEMARQDSNTTFALAPERVRASHDALFIRLLSKRFKLP